MIYQEADCSIEHEGRTFSSGGAFVSPTHIIAYPGNNHVLADWHGKPLGTWRITATWPTPNSYVSSKMHQIEATVDGVVYTGRGVGEGFIYKGKVKKVRSK